MASPFLVCCQCQQSIPMQSQAAFHGMHTVVGAMCANCTGGVIRLQYANTPDLSEFVLVVLFDLSVRNQKAFHKMKDIREALQRGWNVFFENASDMIKSLANVSSVVSRSEKFQHYPAKSKWAIKSPFPAVLKSQVSLELIQKLEDESRAAEPDAAEWKRRRQERRKEREATRNQPLQQEESNSSIGEAIQPLSPEAPGGQSLSSTTPNPVAEPQTNPPTPDQMSSTEAHLQVQISVNHEQATFHAGDGNVMRQLEATSMMPAVGADLSQEIQLQRKLAAAQSILENAMIRLRELQDKCHKKIALLCNPEQRCDGPAAPPATATDQKPPGLQAASTTTKAEHQGVDGQLQPTAVGPQANGTLVKREDSEDTTSSMDASDDTDSEDEAASPLTHSEAPPLKRAKN
eukprot:GGOE01004515.1.p1 GENE.GGOE01004515.1~~GGOE01004515.1.p1  ORF type:complete len:421 (+),score=68.30 GGOE01004515.1:54-1265(+)